MIAAARTARPASCPPIRRGSSGTAEETWVALAGRRLRDPDVAADDVGEDGCGVTVGNRPDRLGGVIVVPGTGTSVVGGSVGTGVDVGAGLPACPTDVVTDAAAGDSAVPLTEIMKVIGTPGVAFALTLPATFSSMA